MASLERSHSGRKPSTTSWWGRQRLVLVASLLHTNSTQLCAFVERTTCCKPILKTRNLWELPLPGALRSSKSKSLASSTYNASWVFRLKPETQVGQMREWGLQRQWQPRRCWRRRRLRSSIGLIKTRRRLKLTHTRSSREHFPKST